MFEKTRKRQKLNILLFAAVAAVSVAAAFFCFASLVSHRVIGSEKVEIREVSDMDGLRTVSDDLRDGDTVRLCGGFTLGENLTVPRAVSLIIEDGADFCGHTLTFASESGTAVSIDCKEKGYNGSVKFDCPESSLEWKGELVPSFYEIVAGSTVKSYNGRYTKDYALGGSGEGEILSLVLEKKNNPWLDEDAVFTAEGNLLIAKLPIICPADGPRAAHLTVRADGEVNFVGCENEDGSVNLTGYPILEVEKNGQTRRYLLKLEREVLGIPAVYIDTAGCREITSTDDYVDGFFSMDTDGYRDFSSVGMRDVKIRGRGNSTWREFDKKPYKLNFNEPVSLFGLPEAENWALFANYADKSLIRNCVAFEMARNLSFDYTPTQYPVDLYLNGEYLGVYTLGEHLESGDGRVDVKPSLGTEDTDYFIEVGGVEAGVNRKGFDYFSVGLINFALIKSPEGKYLTDGQFRFIRNYFKEANDAIVKGGDWEKYIDKESITDWLIMTELTNNTDSAFRRSCYFTKKSGEKLKMGPVWDHDLAFGNFTRDMKDYDSWASSTDDDYVGDTWSTYLFRDEEYMKYFASRWFEVRDTLLSTACDTADRFAEELEESQGYNFKVWDILYERVKFEPYETVNYPTHRSQVRYLKDFLKKRSAWLDEKLGSCK